MDLQELVGMSNRYGSNPEFVLAGGGNTSFKEGDVMYVKASGTRLATITEEGFVPVSRSRMRETMEKAYPDSDREREAAFLADVQAARILPDETRRPSVEALLHALFPQKYVLHLHPTKLNGLTCGKDGESWAKKLYGGDALWIPLCRPGYILGSLCSRAMERERRENGRDTNVILLQNHGVFVAGDSVREIDDRFRLLLSPVLAMGLREPVLEPQMRDESELGAMLACKFGFGGFVSCAGPEFLRLTENREAAAPLLRPFTPDHVVVCGAYPAWLESPDDAERAAGHRVVLVKGHGAFCFGADRKEAETVASLVRDAAGIAAASESFGGPLPMTEDMTDFITHWEAESYRRKKL